ncbi:MAG TPA: GNAT family N-acetyltransferase [Bacillota bacterium]|nr:GNAT family N-acetyltransferase [Bacillota bacterium]HOL09727.1 GNAT family N-acetyltransferase [Bacillota bacterium]HPO98184.1 GNAT family N-acetyltransferase [Bacillota bacterium]
MEPYIDHDEVIANVSVSELQMLIEGQEVSALQIGTVMTHPEYRGKGLARKLMECVIC